MKKFKFKTINLSSRQGSILMDIYRAGKPITWVNLKPTTGSTKFKIANSKINTELQYQGLIEIKKGKKTIKARLTEKGVIECLKMELILTDVLPDGLFCVVMFDIPESKKNLRELLRIFLKDNCFIPFQKSVWISQFNMVNILNQLFSVWKIKQWTKVYIVYEDADQALKNFWK